MVALKRTKSSARRPQAPIGVGEQAGTQKTGLAPDEVAISK
jgi:hypothetical protein